MVTITQLNVDRDLGTVTVKYSAPQPGAFAGAPPQQSFIIAPIEVIERAAMAVKATK